MTSDAQHRLRQSLEESLIVGDVYCRIDVIKGPPIYRRDPVTDALMVFGGYYTIDQYTRRTESWYDGTTGEKIIAFVNVAREQPIGTMKGPK